jgi:drug/metabolite transporter (DMT)-like permease
MSKRGWMLFIAVGIIWGIPYLLIRVAVREVPPETLVFFRTAPATLLLLPLALHGRGLRPVLARWRWIVPYTIVEAAAPWLLLGRGEEHLTSSTAGLLIASVPLIGAVIYRLGPNAEHFDRRRMIGLFVGFAGVAALVGIDVHGTDLAAVAEVLVVALCYAVGALIIGRKLSDLSGVAVVCFSLGLATVGYAPVALTHLPGRLSPEVVLSVALLALVCTALAFVLFFELVVEVAPSRATVITYVNPAVAVILGVLILGEPFTAGIAVGFPLIIVGSILSTRASPAPAPVVPGSPARRAVADGPAAAGRAEEHEIRASAPEYDATD